MPTKQMDFFSSLLRENKTAPSPGRGKGAARLYRMLKKSFLDFFSYDLPEVNSCKSHKLLNF